MTAARVLTRGLLTIASAATAAAGATCATEPSGVMPATERPVAKAIDGYDAIPAPILPAFTQEASPCHVDEARLRFAPGTDLEDAEGNRLVLMPCGTPGAYNEPYALYFGIDEASLHRIVFPDMTKEGPSILMIAYNLTYEPSTKTLTSFHRGRGSGDCGSWYRWHVDLTRSNHVLVLLDQRAKGACDGNDLGGPQNWTPVWAGPPRTGD